MALHYVFAEGGPLVPIDTPRTSGLSEIVWRGVWTWVHEHVSDREMGPDCEGYVCRSTGLRTAEGLVMYAGSEPFPEQFPADFDYKSAVEIARADVPNFRALFATQQQLPIQGAPFAFLGEFVRFPVPGGLMPMATLVALARESDVWTEPTACNLYARAAEHSPARQNGAQRFSDLVTYPARVMGYRRDWAYRRDGRTVLEDQWSMPLHSPFPLCQTLGDCEDKAALTLAVAFHTNLAHFGLAGYEPCLAVVVLGTEEPSLHALAVLCDQAWLDAHWNNPDSRARAALPMLPLEAVGMEDPNTGHTLPCDPCDPLLKDVYPFVITLLRATGTRHLGDPECPGVPWGDTEVRFVQHKHSDALFEASKALRSFLPAMRAIHNWDRELPAPGTAPAPGQVGKAQQAAKKKSRGRKKKAAAPAAANAPAPAPAVDPVVAEADAAVEEAEALVAPGVNANVPAPAQGETLATALAEEKDAAFFDAANTVLAVTAAPRPAPAGADPPTVTQTPTDTAREAARARMQAATEAFVEGVAFDKRHAELRAAWGDAWAPSVDLQSWKEWFARARDQFDQDRATFNRANSDPSATQDWFKPLFIIDVPQPPETAEAAHEASAIARIQISAIRDTNEAVRVNRELANRAQTPDETARYTGRAVVFQQLREELELGKQTNTPITTATRERIATELQELRIAVARENARAVTPARRSATPPRRPRPSRVNTATAAAGQPGSPSDVSSSSDSDTPNTATRQAAPKAATPPPLSPTAASIATAAQKQAEEEKKRKEDEARAAEAAAAAQKQAEEAERKRKEDEARAAEAAAQKQAEEDRRRAEEARKAEEEAKYQAFDKQQKALLAAEAAKKAAAQAAREQQRLKDSAAAFAEFDRQSEPINSNLNNIENVRSTHPETTFRDVRETVDHDGYTRFYIDIMDLWRARNREGEDSLAGEFFLKRLQKLRTQSIVLKEQAEQDQRDIAAQERRAAEEAEAAAAAAPKAVPLLPELKIDAVETGDEPPEEEEDVFHDAAPPAAMPKDDEEPEDDGEGDDTGDETEKKKVAPKAKVVLKAKAPVYAAPTAAERAASEQTYALLALKDPEATARLYASVRWIAQAMRK